LQYDYEHATIGNNKKQKGDADMTLTTRTTTLQAASTIDSLEARFIAYLDAKPRTIDTYRKALKPFFTYLADNGIRNPQRADVVAYRDQLAETLKPSTVRTYLTTVKLFFRWAVQEGLYPMDPTDNVKGPKLDRDYKKDYLTSAQVKAVLAGISRDTLAGKRDYAMLALMIGGGLRTIEVSRANLEDLGTAGDHSVLYLQGKGRDERAEYVKLEAPIEAAIRDYLKARGKGGKALFVSTSNNNRGERLSTRSISGIVKGHLQAAGYDSDRLTAHSLRHTAGNLALEDDASNFVEVQQFMRHSSIDTTMIYVRRKRREANTSEARIAAAIFA
jgi:integrase/recombinase XerC